MALATLSIDLVAQLASLQAGMDKAGRIAEKNAAQIEARYRRMGDVASAIGAALGAAISVAGITAFFRATVDGVDKLNDLKDATGASIENLSALEDIAARTGTSMDTVGDAVIRLNKALSDAKPGSPQAEALKAIGLNATELKRLDPAEALRQVAVALSGFADDGNKARLVQELFGKSLKQVAPLLGDLSRQAQLNGTVTTEQALAAEKFNQQLAALQKNITDGARALVADMLPALNQFAERMKALQNAGGFWRGEFLKFDAEVVTTELANVVAEMESLQATINRQGATAVLEKRMASLREEADALTRKATQASAALKNFAGVGLPLAQGRRPANEGGGRVNAPSLPDVLGQQTVGSKEKPFVPFVVELDDTTKAALKLLESTDAAKIGQLRLELQALIELRSESGAGSVDEAILDIEEALAKLTPEGRAAADAMERLRGILAQTPTGQLADVLSDIDLINAAFSRGQLGPEQWAEAIRVAVAKLPQDVEKPLAEISEFAQQAGRNIQDALGDTLLATMEGSTDKIGDLWAGMIKRMVAQAAAAQLGNALLGADFAKTGQVGGAVGQFWGWLQGLGGARANGGPVQAGRAYLVGERGPEWMVPRTNGTVLPNGVQPTAQRAQVTYAPTFNVASSVSPAQLEAMQARERVRFHRMYA